MTIPTERRPLGYWVEAVARLLASSLEPPLAAAGIDRSEWRTLTVLKRGPATEAELTAAMPPDEAELARPLPQLAKLGWVEETDGRWRLTEAGHLAHNDILRAVNGVRRTAIDGIAPDDFAITIQTLARVADNLAAG